MSYIQEGYIAAPKDYKAHDSDERFTPQPDFFYIANFNSLRTPNSYQTVS
jgi:hypothetical protein